MQCITEVLRRILCLGLTYLLSGGASAEPASVSSRDVRGDAAAVPGPLFQELFPGMTVSNRLSTELH